MSTTRTRTIHKFPLHDVENVVDITCNAVILCVQMQNDVPTLWAEVKPKVFVNEKRVFIVIGTGHDIPDHAKYVGTIQNPPFVWHIYERIKE